MITSVKYAAAGFEFTFSVHASLQSLPTTPGIYALAKFNPSTKHYEILYVGQSNDLCARVCTHEHWDEASRRGMTHVLTCNVSLGGDRDKFERVLIGALNPPLNTLLRPSSRA